MVAPIQHSALPAPHSALDVAFEDDDESDGVSIPIEQWLAEDAGLRVALEEIARKEHLLAALQAQAEAHRLARMLQQVNGTDGMGEVTRLMPAFAFHDIAQQEGTYDCFKDKSFNRYLDRKAPETRVKCYAPKSGNGLPLLVSVNWPGGTKRLTKTYPSAEREAGSAERDRLSTDGPPSPQPSPPGEGEDSALRTPHSALPSP